MQLKIPAAIDIIQHDKKIMVPEIRVWCHNPKGDDYYYVFHNFVEAFKFIKKHPEAEDTPLIAFNGYELNLFDMKK